MSQTQNPSYRNPPVIETVLGVQFEPIPKLTSGLIGKFWSTLNPEDWPTARDADYLQPQHEQFGDHAFSALNALQLHFSKKVQFRQQFESSERDRLIQVQNSRFHLNWKLANSENEYPRYEKLKEEFQVQWESFLAFLNSNGVSEPTIQNWEVTYLNHIPKETVWNNPSDWTFFKLLNSMQPEEDLLNLESFNGEWHFKIPDEKGRLHVRWDHKYSSSEKQELIILNLTSRGPVETQTVQGLMKGLDLGHGYIVNSFQKLMSESSNKFWGLNDGNS